MQVFIYTCQRQSNLLYNIFEKKIMRMKIKNCRYFLIPWIKTTNQLSCALNNCYAIIFFYKKLKRNSEFKKNRKFLNSYRSRL